MILFYQPSFLPTETAGLAATAVIKRFVSLFSGTFFLILYRQEKIFYDRN